MPTGIGMAYRVVEDVGVAVEILRIGRPTTTSATR
jgi:hypothetical protein